MSVSVFKTLARAFCEKVAAGFSLKNAAKQKSRVRFRFNKNEICSSVFAAAIICLTPVMAEAKAPVAEFYLMETPKSFASFEANIDKIDVVAPTWYGVDKNGLVSGQPNPGILKRAKEKKLRVMPIISLTDRPRLHELMQNEGAKKLMIEALLREAKTHGYYGFHFDFENLSWTDKDAYSLMTKQTADALHANGLKLAVAVVPNAPGHAGRGAFSKWLWEYWRGAYDLKALGESADWISLMTYDQHTRWTAPGPVGGMTWVKENIEYTLKFVPPEKLSLGIPLYGYHWYAGNPVKPDGSEASNIVGAYFDADEWQPFVKQHDIKLQWDDVDKESWFWFYRDQMREWAFVPDQRSFKARYDYAKSLGLHGFSAWVLGSEDPAIWNHLPKAERSQ